MKQNEISKPKASMHNSTVNRTVSAGYEVANHDQFEN